jgi:hypothetical protein
MRHETFAQLVANIRRDGCLTQSPFAVRDGDAYLVLSGNHRVKAGIEALGADHQDNILVTDQPLSDRQRTAIQLSHNAIAGEDDPATLRALYDSLDDIDWRAYTGLDDATLDLLAKVDAPSLNEPNLSFQPISLIFLPDEVAQVEAAWAEARALAGGSPAWLARMAEYDATMDAIAATSKAHDIHNIATALLLVLAIFARHRTDLAAGYLDDDGEAKHKGWVPLSSVIGEDDVPAAVAVLLQRAIARMVDRGDVSPDARWQALEHWAADYLAS